MEANFKRYNVRQWHCVTRPKCVISILGPDIGAGSGGLTGATALSWTKRYESKLSFLSSLVRKQLQNFEDSITDG